MSTTAFEEEEASAVIANEFVYNTNERTNLLEPISGSDSSSGYDEEEDDDEDVEEDENGGIPLLDENSPWKAEFQHLSFFNRPSHKILRVALLIYIIGSMSAVTSQIDAMVYLVCRSHYNSLDQTIGYRDQRCLSPEISAMVGIFQTYMTTLTSILGVISVPILSSLSDRVGRKPIFMWTMTCSVITSMITILCCVFPNYVDYRFFLLGSAIDGIGGSLSVLIILCTSYTSDCVREAYRAGALSVLDAFVFAGIALGPTIGSIILNATDHSLVKLFSCSISTQLLALFIFAFVLRESRSEKERRKSIGEHLTRKMSFLDERRRRLSYTNLETINSGASLQSNPVEDDMGFSFSFQYLKEKLRELAHNVFSPLLALRFSHIRDKRSRYNAYILVLVQSALTELSTATIPLLFLYAKTRFHWTSVENGYFISVLGASRFLFLSLIFPLMLSIGRRIWTHSTKGVDGIDKRLIQLGLLCSMTGHFLLSEAPNGKIFLSSILVIALGSGISPLVRNAIIKYSPKHKVGEVLGAASLVTRLENTFVPAIFALVYKYTVSVRPQAVIETIVVVEGLMLAVISLLSMHGDDITSIQV